MKTLKFKRDSWHYELAHKFDRYPDRNLCSYTRHVIGGTLICLGFVVMGSLFGAMFIVEPIVWLIYAFNYSDWSLNTFGAAVLVFEILSFSLAVYFFMYHDDFMDWIKGTTKSIPKDSFIKSAYESFKDKVCFRVDFY